MWCKIEIYNDLVPKQANALLSTKTSKVLTYCENEPSPDLMQKQAKDRNFLLDKN
jgi:hypothetical protein